MKGATALAAAACGVLAATSAHAQDDWYFSLYGGAGTLDDFSSSAALTSPVGTYAVSFTHNTGYAVGVAVGKTFATNWRADAELTYSSAPITRFGVQVTSGGGSGGASMPTNGSTDITWALASVWYDVPTNMSWRPYVGGGIGLAHIRLAAGSAKGDSTNFAAQVGVGVNIDVMPNVTVDAGYRLKAAFDVDGDRFVTGTTMQFSSFTVTQHIFQVGVRIRF